MTIGKRLVEERERLRMTQAQFYRACGTSKSMQFYFETDHSKPGAEYLIKADALGVDVLYVLTGKRCVPATTSHITQTIHSNSGHIAAGDMTIHEAKKRSPRKREL